MNKFSLTIIKEQFTAQNIHIWLNHLFVIYMFFLPISRKARVSTFVIILVLFLIRGDVLAHIKKALSNRVVLAFALYGLIHLVFLTAESFTHLSSTISILKSALFYFYPIIFISFLEYKYIPMYMTAFFFGMLFSELYSYGLFFDLIPYQYSYYQNGIDPSPFFHHTHYGLLLGIVLSLILYNLLSQSLPKWDRIILFGFFLSASTNLFITGGRIGYLLFIFLILIITMRLYKKKSLVYLPITLLFIATVFFTVYSTNKLFHERIDQTINSASLILAGDNERKYNTSFGNRLAFWEVSADVIKKNFFFGVGTANHMDAVDKEADMSQKNPNIVKGLAHTHNEYIRAFLQFGIIGLIVYLNIFYQLLTYKQKDYHFKSFLIILSAAIFTFGFINIVSEKEELSLALFITLPLLFLLKNSNSKDLVDPVYSLRKKQILLYLGIGILIFTISRF